MNMHADLQMNAIISRGGRVFMGKKDFSVVCEPTPHPSFADLDNDVVVFACSYTPEGRNGPILYYVAPRANHPTPVGNVVVTKTIVKWINTRPGDFIVVATVGAQPIDIPLDLFGETTHDPLRQQIAVIKTRKPRTTEVITMVGGVVTKEYPT